jgi:hypothetical protein
MLPAGSGQGCTAPVTCIITLQKRVHVALQREKESAREREREKEGGGEDVRDIEGYLRERLGVGQRMPVCVRSQPVQSKTKKPSGSEQVLILTVFCFEPSRCLHGVQWTSL